MRRDPPFGTGMRAGRLITKRGGINAGRHRNQSAADQSVRDAAELAGGRLGLIRVAFAFIGGAKAIALLIVAMIALTQVAFAVPLATAPVWTYGTTKVPDVPCMTAQEKNSLQSILDRINRWEAEINALTEKASKAAHREEQDRLLSQVRVIIRKQAFFINEYNILMTKIFERRCPKAAVVPPLNFPLIFPLPGGLGLISMLGPHLGFETMETVGCLATTERSATTDVASNRFKDCKDPLGIGIVAGYNFAPWSNNIILGPFASFDWLRQTVNHTFPGGTFLGTTTHWIITAGAKGGLAVAPGVNVYGLAGAAWLNHDLNINFATAASRNTTTPGFTLGLGGEFQPAWLQQFGSPVSVFVQYQHTWWGSANFNTPASSPLFNYSFRREDDTLKLGLNFYLGGTPPPSSRPALITK